MVIKDESIIFGQYQDKIAYIHIKGDHIYNTVFCKDLSKFLINNRGKNTFSIFYYISS